MQLPPTDLEILFNLKLLQDLPPETIPMAQELQGFVQAKCSTRGKILKIESRFFCTHRREVLCSLCPVFRGIMLAYIGVVCSSDAIEFCGQRQG